MNVLNVHRRAFQAPASRVGQLVDSLASGNDALWPREAWPAMSFDRPLGVGADGGHGPVRYKVCDYVPGKTITFKFRAPSGFDGIHRFDVTPQVRGCELSHTLSIRAQGVAKITWPLIFRPMHDALIEDALAKAQAAVNEQPTTVPWSPIVRALRRLVSLGKRPRPQMFYDAPCANSIGGSQR